MTPQVLTKFLYLLHDRAFIPWQTFQILHRNRNSEILQPLANPKAFFNSFIFFSSHFVLPPGLILFSKEIHRVKSDLQVESDPWVDGAERQNEKLVIEKRRKGPSGKKECLKASKSFQRYGWHFWSAQACFRARKNGKKKCSPFHLRSPFKHYKSKIRRMLLAIRIWAERKDKWRRWILFRTWFMLGRWHKFKMR